MKKRKLFVASLGISLIVHMIFAGASNFLWIPGAEALVQKTEKIFDIQTIKLDPPKLTQEFLTKEAIEKIKFKKPDTPPKEVASKKLLDKIKAPKIKPPKREPKKLDTSDKSLLPDAKSVIKKQKPLKKDRTIDKNTNVEIDIFEAIDPLLQKLDEDVEVPEDFTESMFAFTPRGLEASDITAGTGEGFGIKSDEKITKESKVESIDKVMNVVIHTYRDPRNNQGYYRVAIRPGHGAQNLKVLPKEVIFLVDASLSIKKQRLYQFIKGIRSSVQDLNPNDKFNIYTFKDRITPLSDTPVSSDEDSVKNAVNFLNKLEPSEQTDIYQAFLDSVQEESAVTPSYIIFISDGRPTHGLTSSAKLIGEISRINQRERSFFSFSGGTKVNRYLLDFLSYQNRGWSEYAASTHEIGNKIFELYQKIKNPLFTNVRYQLVNLKEKNAYPKYLPDFYRNTEFVIYGRYTDEDKFSMRFLGDVESETKEFIFSQKLSEANSGGKEIALHWAFNKFYHLISQATLEGPTPEIKDELEKLHREFGIKSPYNI